MPDWIRTLACVLTGAACAGITLTLAQIPPLPRPVLGFRGRARTKALEQSVLLRFVDPPIRKCAAWYATLTCWKRLKPTAERLRLSQAVHLEQAGHYWGLSPDEYTAFTVLSAVTWALLFSMLISWLQQGALGIGLGFALGAALPYWRVEGALRERCKIIRRGFPAAVDLAALCVGAGLDFPGALLAIANNSDEGDPVAGEFRHILAMLDVGHTRRHALAQLERRVPVQCVRDFVRALTQAEEKGNPIHEALTIQASMARMQRSVAAEEAAARAGVLMIVPMALLLGCILLMLMGPFLVNGMGF
ncbi:MAG TPA: type II secretion system F family protein [Polyangiaceae bacterium]|nr:type II secretion system F family protein [Polyangiaceae bacterium]